MSTGDDIAIGIDVGNDYIRASVWDAKEKKAVALVLDGEGGEGEDGCKALPACVAFTRPTESVVGEAAFSAASAEHTVLGLSRLLGRTYDSAESTQWLEVEGGTMPYALASAEDSNEVRVALTFERVESRLRKRGEAPRVMDGKQRSKSIKKSLSPEEVLYKLLQRVKKRAQEFLEAEVTHCVLSVPSHFGLAQRQCVADSAVLAGLAVLGVASSATSLLALPKHFPPPAADQPRRPQLLVDWGAGSCTAAAARFEEGCWRVVAVAGDEEIGGFALDRLVAASLARQANVKQDSAHNRLALMLAAKGLKHALSSNPNASTQVELELETRDLHLSRQEWEAATAFARPRFEALLSDVEAQARASAKSSEKLEFEVHVSGGQARSPALRSLLEAAAVRLGSAPLPPLPKRQPEESQQAHGAAVLAAHHLQPSALLAALRKGSGGEWSPPREALAHAVCYRESSGEQAGEAIELFPRLSTMPQHKDISFELKSQARKISFFEIAHQISTSGDPKTPKREIPLISLDLEAAPRGSRTADAAPPSQQVAVDLSDSGLCAEAEEIDVPAGSKFGCGTTFVLILLVAVAAQAAAPLFST